MFLHLRLRGFRLMPCQSNDGAKMARFLECGDLSPLGIAHDITTCRDEVSTVRGSGWVRHSPLAPSLESHNLTRLTLSQRVNRMTQIHRRLMRVDDMRRIDL